MQVLVGKKDLHRILDRCQAVADKKSTMPVLGNVLLEVGGPSQLRLAATDLFLAVAGSIPAEVDKGGGIAVPARDLLERVRKMPDGQIALSSTDGSSLTLKAAGTARRFTVHGLPGDDFPALPKPDENVSVLSLPVSTLSTLIQSTQFSISTDDSRLALNSALFESDGNRLRMVTTDGHRLTKAEAVLSSAPSAFSILIPHKGIQQLKRICDDALSEAGKTEDGSVAEPTLQFSQMGPNAFFQIASVRFSVKLVDAQFPPYDQVIPQTSEHAIRVARAVLDEALGAVAVAASDRTSGVKLSLAGGVMRMETESPESGEAFDEIAVDYGGPDLTIGFNARYFRDVLAVVPDEEILIGLGGELDPAVVRPGTGSSSFDFLSVVMPMRI